jgi:hypothetical protein
MEKVTTEGVLGISGRWILLQPRESACQIIIWRAIRIVDSEIDAPHPHAIGATKREINGS